MRRAIVEGDRVPQYKHCGIVRVDTRRVGIAGHVEVDVALKSSWPILHDDVDGPRLVVAIRGDGHIQPSLFPCPYIRNLLVVVGEYVLNDKHSGLGFW